MLKKWHHFKKAPGGNACHAKKRPYIKKEPHDKMHLKLKSDLIVKREPHDKMHLKLKSDFIIKREPRNKSTSS